MRTAATDRQGSSFLERTALLGASAAVLISVVGLLGWGLGLPVLTSVRPSYIPIALSSCIALLVQGTILIVHVLWPSHARRWPFVVLAAGTAIFGMLAFAGAFVHLDMYFEGAVLPSDERFAQFPVNRMSPLTGVLVCSTGVSLLLLLLHKTQKLVPHLAAGLASLVAMAGLIGTVGYLYGTPLLYRGAVTPMALMACSAFMFLGAGLVPAIGPSAFLIGPLTGGSVRAMILRTFVPLGFIAVIGSDIFQNLVTRLDSAIVSAASAVFFGMATIIIVVQAARMIGRIIDKAEAERALAEKELLRAKQDWERTFDSVPDLVAILDDQNRITRVNQAMADRLGLTPEQCIGESCYKVVHGEAEAPAFCPHVLTCRDGLEHDAEVYEPRLGGYFQISTTPIFDEQKQPVGVVHVARDITRHKQAEVALREAHDNLDAIIDFLPDATFVIDASGRVIAWNRAIEEMTGVSKADMLQMADYEYAIPFYGERRPLLIDLILKPDPELETIKYDYVQRHGNLLYGETYVPKAFGGKGAYIWSAASVLRDSSGNAVGAIQSLRDVTERKRAEQERLRLEQQLLQVQKAESLGRMAGAIAHHFNNKLTVVIGNLELALGFMPPESPPRTRVLQAMKASHQAAEISRLMLACIGQTAEKKEPLYLAETIRETLPPLTASLPQNVHLISEVPLQGPVVLADPVHIKQILTNLVLNASEAIGDQEGDVSLAIREVFSPQFRESKVFPPEWESRAEGYVCLSVSDTGCGLDTSTQEKIFDPFFSTKFTGRGLGLSVVLGLVRAYEGAIVVESQVGRGTTFQVFFPSAAAEELPSRDNESVVSAEIEAGLLVLFIDDEPMMRDIGKDMFNMLGCEAIVAADGPEGVEIFRTRKDEVSLVVLDINMPLMNGWETLRVLRSLRPDIPVVMASGHDENQVIQQDYSDRPQAYLEKPYRLENLKAAIDRARSAPLVGKEKAA